jgi:predicted transcriptional regulator
MAKRSELINLVLVALYESGLMTGPDLMARTGLTGAEAKDIVGELMNKKGLVGQDGEGKGAKFGLTEEGITHVENEGLVETAEEGEDEGQFEDAEELVVDDSDEFAQEPPAKRASKTVAPAPRAAASKAPAPAPRPSGASKGASKAAAPAPRASSKATPAASKKGVAPKPRAVEVEEDDAEPVWRPKSVTTYDGDTLQAHVDVINDYVGQFIEAARKGKDGFPIESDPNAILAIALMRQNKRYERRLENGNYVGGANEGGGGKE